MGDPVAELTEAVMKAKRGLRVHTERLAALLPKHKLLLPLGRPVPAGTLDVAYHGLEEPNGGRFCPLFTEDQILSAAGHHRRWKTSGGPLMQLEWSGDVALRNALDWIEGGAIQGVALNPFHPSALELLPDEVRGLLSRDPGALRRHLLVLPIQPEEKLITRWVQTPLPKPLVEAVKGLVRSRRELARFSFMEVVSAERDAPSLLLTIDTTVAVDGPAYAEAVQRAVAGKIPPAYSHIDVMFMGAGTTQQPRP